MPRYAFILLVSVFVLAPPLAAQTATISYQGRINENNAPAVGSFDLEFRLFAAAAGAGAPLAVVTQSDVAVADGVFSVQLAFPANAFSGAARHLEIAGRLDGRLHRHGRAAARRA